MYARAACAVSFSPSLNIYVCIDTSYANRNMFLNCIYVCVRIGCDSLILSPSDGSAYVYIYTCAHIYYSGIHIYTSIHLSIYPFVYLLINFIFLFTPLYNARYINLASGRGHQNHTVSVLQNVHRHHQRPQRQEREPSLGAGPTERKAA